MLQKREQATKCESNEEERVFVNQLFRPTNKNHAYTSAYVKSDKCPNQKVLRNMKNACY
jgi:hypothetical protein